MDTLRDDLNAAIEEEESNAPENETEEETGSQEGEAADGESGESGESSSEGGEADTKGDPAEGEGTPEAATDDAKEPDATDGEKEVPAGINAPIGYSAEAREVWAKVPKSVQEQVHKREVEIATAMQGTSDARKTHQHISKLAGNYAPVLAAEGAENPMAAIEGLFQTVAELRMGSPQQKATKMAALINHYGIDIAALDGALVGNPSQGAPADNGMSQMIDDRLAPMMEMFNAQKQQATDTSNNAVLAEVKEFSGTAEFINDVRMDMADLIDLADKQGRQLTLQDAYNKACQLNPSVQKVMADRKLQQGNASIADKKIVASGLKANSSAASGQTKAPANLRDEISTLWDQYST